MIYTNKATIFTKDATMRSTFLECGARQITVNHDDKFEILFLNDEGKEVAIVSSVLNRLLFSVIRYDENNIRKNAYQFSVKVAKESEEVVAK